MAKRNTVVVVKDTRPTLAEVKAQAGKYVLASYRGYEQGSICLPAPDAYELGLPAGYQPKELVIRPWIWDVIPSYWLDDTNFGKVYQRTSGLVVKRVDNIPPTEADPLVLDDDLEKKLSYDHKQKAWWIATEPYFDNKSEAGADDPRRGTYALIHMRDMDQPDDSPQQVDFLQNTLAPILQAARVYEERLGNRPEVIRAIEKRLDEIGGQRVYGGARKRGRGRPISTPK